MIDDDFGVKLKKQQITALTKNKFLSTTPSIKTMNSDTGSTGNYIAISDMALLSNIKTAKMPLSVQLPDGTLAYSTHVATLNLPQLAPSARVAHIFPTFTASLISTGVLCDAGYTTTYDKQKVTVKDSEGKILLSGERDFNTGLWNYSMDSKQSYANAASLYPTALINTKKYLASWYHACMGSPAIPTFLQAVTNKWIDLPGLTPAMVRKLQPTVATQKGHLRGSTSILHIEW
jgi:hypothetical protein